MPRIIDSNFHLHFNPFDFPFSFLFFLTFPVIASSSANFNTSTIQSKHYGHPSLDAVATRFLGREPPLTQNDKQTLSILDAYRQMRIDQMIQLYNEAVKEVEFESRRSREVNQRVTGVEAKGWWSGGMEEFDVQELFQLHAALGHIENSLRTVVDGRRLPVYEAPFSVSLPPMNIDVGVYPMNSYTYPFATIANETSGINPTNFDLGGQQQL